MGVRGKGDYEHEVLIWSRPRWRFAYFAAMGKVGRRPQAAKSPMKRSPLRSGHRVVAQASFFAPAGQFTFSHPYGETAPLSACHSEHAI